MPSEIFGWTSEFCIISTLALIGKVKRDSNVETSVYLPHDFLMFLKIN
jgi:hypothetical protein